MHVETEDMCVEGLWSTCHGPTWREPVESRSALVIAVVERIPFIADRCPAAAAAVLPSWLQLPDRRRRPIRCNQLWRAGLVGFAFSTVADWRPTTLDRVDRDADASSRYRYQPTEYAAACVLRDRARLFFLPPVNPLAPLVPAF